MCVCVWGGGECVCVCVFPISSPFPTLLICRSSHFIQFIVCSIKTTSCFPLIDSTFFCHSFSCGRTCCCHNYSMRLRTEHIYLPLLSLSHAISLFLPPPNPFYFYCSYTICSIVSLMFHPAEPSRQRGFDFRRFTR